MTETQYGLTNTFDIEYLGEVIVGFNKVITHYPERIEDGHGKHKFNEDDVKLELQSCEVTIAGKGCEILLLLNEKQKQSIIDKLTYE